MLWLVVLVLFAPPPTTPTNTSDSCHLGTCDVVAALRAGPPQRTISLLGLFELTGPQGEKRAEGRSELEAARLAVSHINQRGSSLLPGFKLQLLTNDTKVKKQNSIYLALYFFYFFLLLI